MWLVGIKTRPGWRGRRETEAETSSFPACVVRSQAGSVSIFPRAELCAEIPGLLGKGQGTVAAGLGHKEKVMEVLMANSDTRRDFRKTGDKADLCGCEGEKCFLMLGAQ